MVYRILYIRMFDTWHILRLCAPHISACLFCFWGTRANQSLGAGAFACHVCYHLVVAGFWLLPARIARYCKSNYHESPTIFEYKIKYIYIHYINYDIEKYITRPCGPSLTTNTVVIHWFHWLSRTGFPMKPLQLIGHESAQLYPTDCALRNSLNHCKEVLFAIHLLGTKTSRHRWGISKIRSLWQMSHI